MTGLGMVGASAQSMLDREIPFRSEDRQEMHGYLTSEVIASLGDIPLTRSTRNMLDRFVERVLDEDYGLESIATMLPEISRAIGIDMTTHRFLMIPEERREFYEQAQPPFGDEVADTFPSAKRDISAAARSVALDEWTSCVFHLMRALEVGLHDLAERLELPSAELETENWKNIIDRIEKVIRDMEKLPRSREKTEKVRFYAEAMNGFRSFKDAWRNHVSHARAFYDEREALTIYSSTQSFMQVLAQGLGENEDNDD